MFHQAGAGQLLLPILGLYQSRMLWEEGLAKGKTLGAAVELPHRAGNMLGAVAVLLVVALLPAGDSSVQLPVTWLFPAPGWAAGPTLPQYSHSDPGPGIQAGTGTAYPKGQDLIPPRDPRAGVCASFGDGSRQGHLCHPITCDSLSLTCRCEAARALNHLPP